MRLLILALLIFISASLRTGEADPIIICYKIISIVDAANFDMSCDVNGTDRNYRVTVKGVIFEEDSAQLIYKNVVHEFKGIDIAILKGPVVRSDRIVCSDILLHGISLKAKLKAKGFTIL